MITTYSHQQHPVSGSPIIQRTGRTAGAIEQPAHGKKRVNTYELKENCELNLKTDSIQWMTKNEIRKAKRRNKK